MYKKTYHIIISCIFGLLFQITHCSESKNNLTPKKMYGYAIETFKNPTSVILLPNNQLAIASPSKLIAYDLCSFCSQKIESHRNFGIYDITTNPQRTYFAVATAEGTKIYDLIKQKTVYKSDNTYSSTQKKFIVLDSENTIVTYIPGKNADILSIYNLRKARDFQNPNNFSFKTENTDPQRSIALHRSQNSIIYPFNSHQYITTEVNPSTGHLMAYTYIALESTEHIIDIEYNHDETLLAVNEKNKGCSLFNNKQPTPYRCHSNAQYFCHNSAQKTDDKAVFYPAMAFGPNNILALLSWENTLQFWDCNTRQLIFTTLLDSAEAIGPQQEISKRLSFSLDGTQLAVALQNKCFVFFTPPVMHAPQSKTMLLHSFWLLRNLPHLSENGLPDIPHDIVWLIIKNIIMLNQMVTTHNDQPK